MHTYVSRLAFNIVCVCARACECLFSCICPFSFKIFPLLCCCRCFFSSWSIQFIYSFSCHSLSIFLHFFLLIYLVVSLSLSSYSSFKQSSWYRLQAANFVASATAMCVSSVESFLLRFGVFCRYFVIGCVFMWVYDPMIFVSCCFSSHLTVLMVVMMFAIVDPFPLIFVLLSLLPFIRYRVVIYGDTVKPKSNTSQTKQDRWRSRLYTCAPQFVENVYIYINFMCNVQ